MVPGVGWFLHLKETAILKLGLDSIDQFPKVMISGDSVKKVMVSFVLVILAQLVSVIMSYLSSVP